MYRFRNSFLIYNFPFFLFISPSAAAVVVGLLPMLFNSAVSHGNEPQYEVRLSSTVYGRNTLTLGCVLHEEYCMDIYFAININLVTYRTDDNKITSNGK
jgi:hypothetical protein